MRLYMTAIEWMLISSDYSEESVVFCSGDEANVGAGCLCVVDALFAAKVGEFGEAFLGALLDQGPAETAARL